MHPAVPPVFRQKANTFLADNGALPYQTTEGSFDMLRREMLLCPVCIGFSLADALWDTMLQSC